MRYEGIYILGIRVLLRSFVQLNIQDEKNAMIILRDGRTIFVTVNSPNTLCML